MKQSFKNRTNHIAEQETHFQAIFDQAGVGVILVESTTGKYLRANKKYCDIVGYSEEELRTIDFHSITHPDDHKSDSGIMECLISGKIREFTRDKRYIRKNGDVVWVNGTVSAMWNPGEGPSYHITVIQDITERKLKEEEVRLNSEIFKNVSEGIHLMGMEDGLIKHANSKFEQMFGYRPGEMIGKDVSILNAPTDKLPQETKADILNCLRKNERWNGEIKNIRKDGTTFWSYVNVSLFDHHQYGRVIVSIHTDITRRKQVEEKLRESEAKYRDLFENAQDPMFVTDIEANFVKVNKIGIEMLGCTKEEVIGSNISRWVTPESLIIIHGRRKKRISGEKVIPTDIIEIVGKNNEHRWVEIRTRVIISDDRVIEIHGIARDITENRILKQELNKSNKQQKLLCYLIQGTRGGKTRALILKHLSDKSYNAHELSTSLNMDYKTIRHHLNVLVKNGIVGKNNNGYSDLYFITNKLDLNMNG